MFLIALPTLPEEIKIRTRYNLFCRFAFVEILPQDVTTLQANVFLVKLVRDFFQSPPIILLILLPDLCTAKAIDPTASEGVHVHKQLALVASRGELGKHVNVQLLAADPVLVANSHRWKFHTAFLFQVNLQQRKYFLSWCYFLFGPNDIKLLIQ